jgi:tetratricopeptide (TPR) repeat protein
MAPLKTKVRKPIDTPIPKKEASSRRREVIAVAVVLLIAVVFKAVYLFQYKLGSPYYYVPIVDSQIYDVWALKVAKGEGYGRMPFYMAPLYPYLLGLIYKIFGHTKLVVYVVQMFLGLCNAFLVYLLGRKFWGHKYGLIGMCLILGYAPLVYLETKLLTETLAVTLNLVSVLLVICAVHNPSKIRFLAAGVALGVSALCRPVGTIVVGLIFLWLVVQAVRGRCGIYLSHAAVLILGFALALSPVTIRNYLVSGEFVPISANGGVVFAQGNNSRSKGLFSTLPGFSGSVKAEYEEAVAVASRALGHKATSSEMSAYWFRYAVDFIRTHPWAYIKLIGLKILWSLHNRESTCIYSVYLEKRLVPVTKLLVVPYGVIAGLGFCGMVLAARSRAFPGVRVLMIYVLSIYLSLLIFSVSSRYRVPAIPGLAVFAGCGLGQFFEAVKRRQIYTVVLALTCVASLFAVSLIPYPQSKITAETLANLGAGYLALGRTEQAIEHLEEAIEMKPNFAYAHLTLAHALVKVGRRQEAICEFREAIRLNPGNATAHLNLGTLLDEEGKIDEAIREYQKAISIRPELAEAHNNLAVALYFKGRYRDAWKEVELSRKYGREPHPDFIRALASKMPHRYAVKNKGNRVN